MARNKLTETRIRTLAPGVHSDGDGLYLRVWPSGSRNWLFIYVRDGKRTEMGLGGRGGTAPVSLKLAREKAEDIRSKLARGIDPREERRKKATTFRDVAESTLAVHEAKFGEKHRRAWRKSLFEHVAALHDVPIERVTRDDIYNAILPVWKETEPSARRTLRRVAAVFDHAKARGLFEGDNPAAWKGGLKELLPARARDTKHHEALDYRAAPAVIARLRESTALGARFVEFLMLTAVRFSDARNVTWDEIDFDEAVWTIPAPRMKMKKEHRVPLCGRAVSILRAQQQQATGKLVFPGAREGRPVSETPARAAFKAAGAGEATMHGMRSTFRDWAGDETAHAREQAEAALAHAVGSAVELAYRRKDALEKRRALMADWERYLRG